MYCFWTDTDWLPQAKQLCFHIHKSEASVCVETIVHASHITTLPFRALFWHTSKIICNIHMKRKYDIHFCLCLCICALNRWKISIVWTVHSNMNVPPFKFQNFNFKMSFWAGPKIIVSNRLNGFLFIALWVIKWHCLAVLGACCLSRKYKHTRARTTRWQSELCLHF